MRDHAATQSALALEPVRAALRKDGYPPDKQEQATQTVLEQAEVLSQEWAAA